MTPSITRIDARDKPLAARRAALHSAEASGRQTPGRYMRACRHRAGLSRAQVAEKICAAPGDYAHTECALRDLETDQPGEYARLVRSLTAHRAFPFDQGVFFSLASATSAPALDEFAAA